MSQYRPCSAKFHSSPVSQIIVLHWYYGSLTREVCVYGGQGGINRCLRQSQAACTGMAVICQTGWTRVSLNGLKARRRGWISPGGNQNSEVHSHLCIYLRRCLDVVTLGRMFTDDNRHVIQDVQDTLNSSTNPGLNGRSVPHTF